MTLLPLDSWNVKGIAGPAYKVGPRCCNPRCRKVAEHAHHVWPRSFLRKQPQNWVELPDGTVVGNRVAVCADCHDDITGRLGGHRAAIRLGINDSRFWWCTTAGRNGATTYDPLDPIDPQPPTRDSLVASPATSGSEACPTCGQVKPARRSSDTPPDGERRRRKSWTIPVPDDAEDGAWVLDTLVDDLAPLMGLHPNKQGRWTSARYYVLVPALYFAQQHREQFLKEVLDR